MRRIIAIAMLVFCGAAWGYGIPAVTSTSTTPVRVDLSLQNSPVWSVQVTVGAGATCLAEYSNTIGAGTSGGNWLPIGNLSSITASASATLPSPVQAVRISETVAATGCTMEITGVNN